MHKVRPVLQNFQKEKHLYFALYKIGETVYVFCKQTEQSFFCRCETAIRCADTAGERDKVVMGLFENYLRAKTKDPHLELVRNKYAFTHK